MNFSLMGNLSNWQMSELCLGKAPKKEIHISLKRNMHTYNKIDANITQYHLA